MFSVKVARLLKLDVAPAMVGWERGRGGRSAPALKGVVCLREHAHALWTVSKFDVARDYCGILRPFLIARKSCGSIKWKLKQQWNAGSNNWDKHGFVSVNGYWFGRYSPDNVKWLKLTKFSCAAHSKQQLELWNARPEAGGIPHGWKRCLPHAQYWGGLWRALVRTVHNRGLSIQGAFWKAINEAMAIVNHEMK